MILSQRLTTMTQDLLDQPDSSQAGIVGTSEDVGWGAETQSADFNYTPISPWSTIALTLGLLGLTAFWGIFGIVVAAVGIVISIAAVVRIKGEQGAVRGMLAAVLGLVLSLSSVGGGIATQVYNFNHEVPEGYIRVNFPKEISAHQFNIYRGGQRSLAQEVAKFVGAKIFIKGWMWQTQKSEGLEEFVFLKDNGDCCFGGSPAAYDMMQVQMQDGKTTNAHNGMVSVAGTLRVNLAAGQDEAVYILEAQLVEPSRTRF
jgi:hypothetical protein